MRLTVFSKEGNLSGGDKLVALTTSLPFPRSAKMSRFKADVFGCDTSGCPPRYEALKTKRFNCRRSSSLLSYNGSRKRMLRVCEGGEPRSALSSPPSPFGRAVLKGNVQKSGYSQTPSVIGAVLLTEPSGR
ncbi:putative two-component response regulator ARR13, partial [Dissostichus eleginoides]